eukprot:jgi/Chlat1/2786/Chrsp187S02956
MCGRTRCTLAPEQVQSATNTNVPPEQWRDMDRYRPSYNVSPGFYAPVVRAEKDGGRRTVQAMRWGLVPSFTRKDDKPNFFRMFNARSETVGDKSSFRRLLTRNRCVAVVNGFYEWQKQGAKKLPWYIHWKEGEERPIMMAALYDTWQDANGETLYTFTIMTTRSSKSLSWLHDRMPVILPDEAAVNTWLAPDLDLSKAEKTLFEPYNGRDLVWFRVTPEMNRMNYDGPECCKEVHEEAKTTAATSQIARLFGAKRKGDERVKEEKEASLPLPESKHVKLDTEDSCDTREYRSGLPVEHDDEEAAAAAVESRLKDEHRAEVAGVATINADEMADELPVRDDVEAKVKDEREEKEEREEREEERGEGVAAKEAVRSQGIQLRRRSESLPSSPAKTRTPTKTQQSPAKGVKSSPTKGAKSSAKVTPDKQCKLDAFFKRG